MESSHFQFWRIPATERSRNPSSSVSVVSDYRDHWGPRDIRKAALKVQKQQKTFIAQGLSYVSHNSREFRERESRGPGRLVKLEASGKLTYSISIGESYA